MFELKRNIRNALFPALSAIVVCYFSYYAITGAHGYLALISLQQKIETRTAVLDELDIQRSKLEHKAHLLSSEAIDPDYLEERARKLLGLAREGDLVVWRADPADQR